MVRKVEGCWSVPASVETDVCCLSEGQHCLQVSLLYLYCRCLTCPCPCLSGSQRQICHISRVRLQPSKLKESRSWEEIGPQLFQ